MCPHSHSSSTGTKFTGPTPFFQLQTALHDAGDQRYVTLSLELRGWDFIKHQFRMRVDTPMYTIKVCPNSLHIEPPYTPFAPTAQACREAWSHERIDLIQGETSHGRLSMPCSASRRACLCRVSTPRATPSRLISGHCRRSALTGRLEGPQRSQQQSCKPMVRHSAHATRPCACLCVFRYDFKPYSHDEPVLLAAHQRDVVKVNGTPGPSPSRAAYAVPPASLKEDEGGAAPQGGGPRR